MNAIFVALTLDRKLILNAMPNAEMHNNSMNVRLCNDQPQDSRNNNKMQRRITVITLVIQCLSRKYQGVLNEMVNPPTTKIANF